MNLLADTMVSPTRYMQAYFRQRGWQMPEDNQVIPNVMPSFQEERAAATHRLGNIRQALQLVFLAY